MAPTLSVEVLIIFCRERAADAQKWAKSRRDAADTWTTGTDAEHRSAHQLAERTGGRRIPFNSAAERQRLGEKELSIAAKHDAEARIFEAIADRLEAHHAR